jgi:tRNA-specific adenosine deaminase 3
MFFQFLFVDKLPVGYYLCTGLDLFVRYEPDLFTSMALVHSRIRRVYYIEDRADIGALCSGNGHIHSLRELNHHYRVFRVKIESNLDNIESNVS